MQGALAQELGQLERFGTDGPLDPATLAALSPPAQARILGDQVQDLVSRDRVAEALTLIDRAADPSVRRTLLRRLVDEMPGPTPAVAPGPHPPRSDAAR